MKIHNANIPDVRVSASRSERVAIIVKAAIVIAEDRRLPALDLLNEALEELEVLVRPMDGHLFGSLGLCG